MHLHFLDPYHESRSLVHQLDARIKLILVVAFILTVALVPAGTWPVYVLLVALALAAELLSELGILFYLKRALLAVPFVLAALPVLFTIPGPPLLQLPFGLWISEPGFARFISVALKSWISVQMAILLAATTRFPDILLAMRAVRLPRLLVAIIGLMWRYLFVMVDEAIRLMRARQARSGISQQLHSGPGDGSRGTPYRGHKAGGSFSWRARVTGNMAGSLLIRSLERSDRIYNAMLARGYDGELRALPQAQISPAGWAALVLGLALLGGLLLFGYLL
jgi:cobalt/nickel transport system permease protein